MHSPKVKIDQINQVSIVVVDLQSTMRNYWDIFGIGPWDVYKLEPPLMRDHEYHGRSVNGQAKIGLAQAGALQLELVEHIDGETIYRDFLKEYGGGLHHLNFPVDDVDQVVRALGLYGCVCLQQARYGNDGAIAYIYVDPLHCIWEPICYPKYRGIEPTKYRWQLPDNTSATNIKFDGIRQVSLVVRDLESTIRDYWNIFGIGPWKVYEWEAPYVYNYRYHGNPSNARAKLAFAVVKELQLEMVQHVSGESIYRDFLVSHGEGLHSLGFITDDFYTVIRKLESQGFNCIQSACFGDNGLVAYFDIQPLHTIWKVISPSQHMRFAPTRFPPLGVTLDGKH